MDISKEDKGNSFPEGRNRRESERFFIEGQIPIRLKMPQESPSETTPMTMACTLRNVSSEGLSLTSGQEVPAASLIDIWLSPERVDREIPFTARVKWCLPAGNIGTYILGVKFLDPGGTNLNFFQSLLEDREITRSGLSE